MLCAAGLNLNRVRHLISRDNKFRCASGPVTLGLAALLLHYVKISLLVPLYLAILLDLHFLNYLSTIIRLANLSVHHQAFISLFWNYYQIESTILGSI